jgi:hypothetical protein
MAFDRSQRPALDATGLLAPIAAIGLGFGLGFAGALAESGPLWMQVLQLPSAWLLLAVAVGTTANGWRSAMLWGSVALLIAVGVYYVTLLETGIRVYYDTAQRAAFVWGLVGLGCAPPMAFTGWMLANGRPGLSRGLVALPLVGWLWCEAALIWVLWASGWPTVAALVEVGLGAAILAHATRRPALFTLSAAGSLLVAVVASSIGLAIWRSIDCAAGKVCY